MDDLYRVVAVEYNDPLQPSTSESHPCQSHHRDLQELPTLNPLQWGSRRLGSHTWTTTHESQAQQAQEAQGRQPCQPCSRIQRSKERLPGEPKECAHESEASVHRTRSQPESHRPSEPHR